MVSDPSQGVPQPGMARQFRRYVLAGSAALATHLTVLILLVELTGMPKTAATMVGFAAALPVNYLLQHAFVFSPQSRDHAVFFTRYLVVTLTAAGLNALLFAGLVRGGQVPYPVAQVIATGVIFVLNFLANRSFTFRTGERG